MIYNSHNVQNVYNNPNTPHIHGIGVGIIGQYFRC